MPIFNSGSLRAKRSNLIGTVLALIIASISACGSETGTETGNPATTTEQAAAPATVTLSTLQTDIFTPSCAKAGCHAASSAAGGMSLAAGDSFANLVGVTSTEAASLKRVAAGSSSTSYIINKLEGTQSSVGGSGSRMPKDASALTDAQIQSIKDWIDAGAKND